MRPPESLDCVSCETGVAFLKRADCNVTVNGKDHIVTELYYECRDCKTQFTTTEADTVTYDQIDLLKRQN